MEIKEPTSADCEKLAEKLSRGYYVRDAKSHEPIPCISNFHVDGLVSQIFSTKKAATEAAELSTKEFETKTEVLNVSGLWDLFRECALCGYEGVVLDATYPVTFYNRLSDMDRDVPTLMWMRFPDSENDLYGFYFSRMGIVEVESGTTVKWVDYERFDKAWNRYVLREDPLPESIEAHTIVGELGQPAVFENGASFLGPYVSDIGAIPVFSARPWAVYFAQRNGLFEGFDGDDVKLARGFQIKRIDLFELLSEVKNQHGPFLDVGLNSLCHRVRQGWLHKSGDDFLLETISGSWEISANGVKARNDGEPYKPHLGLPNEPSLIASGVSTVVENTFKRITGADRSPFSDDDAVAVLDAQLAQRGPDSEPMIIEENQTIPRDAFVIDGFDKVTGESVASALDRYPENSLQFIVFKDIICAASFLIHDVLPHDEVIRTEGCTLCHGGGVSGSNDPKRESRVTAGVILAIRKTLHDALTRGYRPMHALHLKKLMQDVSRTFEVQDIGYFGDLLFYGTTDGRDIWDRLDLDDEMDQTRRVNKLKAVRKKLADRIETSPELTARLRRPLGFSYDMLTPESRVIASSVLADFDQVGQRADYDYSGIAMKTAKLVERELGVRVFRRWREDERKSLSKDQLKTLRETIEQHPIDRCERALIDWLQKRNKLTLGSMRYCIQATRSTDTDGNLRNRLREYICALPNGEWLTSSDFDDVLEDISTRYRNGGVHEHLVSFDVCHEAVERILIGDDPVLKKLLVATEARVN